MAGEFKFDQNSFLPTSLKSVSTDSLSHVDKYAAMADALHDAADEIIEVRA